MSQEVKDSRSSNLLADVARIEVAMREAAEDAIQLHIRLNLPLVEWHDGKVVLIPPDQLQVDAVRL